MRISDWSSDVCSSDLTRPAPIAIHPTGAMPACGVALNIMCGTTPAHSTLPRVLTKIQVMNTENATTRRKNGRKNGRASGRERVVQYGEILEVAGALKKKKTRTHQKQ